MQILLNQTFDSSISSSGLDATLFYNSFVFQMSEIEIAVNALTNNDEQAPESQHIETSGKNLFLHWTPLNVITSAPK